MIRGISPCIPLHRELFICPIFLRCLNVQFAANVLEHPTVTQKRDCARGRRFGVHTYIENNPRSLF